jgi:hypothetical protein
MDGDASLQRTALDHLWLHFTDMGGTPTLPTCR